MANKILLTAFEPFGKSPISSSLELAKALAKDRDLSYGVLPVSYHRAEETLSQLLATHHPDILLMLGQAGGDREIRIENIAINQRDVNLADNDGYIAYKEIIDIEQPMALFTTAPVCTLRDELRAADIPAKRSNSAGLFVCNSTYFFALGNARALYPKLETLFIHLPILPEQAISYPNRFTMELSKMIQGLNLIIDHYLQ
jgi:pyroglutamyl-peptidase I